MAIGKIEPEMVITSEIYTVTTSSEAYWSNWHYGNIYIGDKINNIISIEVITPDQSGTSNTPTLVQKLYGNNYLRLWTNGKRELTSVKVTFCSQIE